MLGGSLFSCRWGMTISLGYALSLGACNSSDDQETTCNLSANGLKSEGWDGAELGDKQLSFIFLKGPSAVTSDVGDFLQAQGIAAVFFVQGVSVEGNKNHLATLKEQGHLIGNGGYRYQDVTQTVHPVLELRTADGLITPYVSNNMFLFYAPLKSFNEQAAASFRANGLGKYVGPIHDDTTPSETFRYDEQCWAEGIEPAGCAAQYFDEIKRLGKGIVAFNDTDPRTLELLQELVPQLSAFGFSFARIDQIPSIRTALTRAGALVDETGANSCDDYD